MISIHDNEITSYLVDLKYHKIILYTEASNSERVEVSFEDVLAHQFETLEGSIILDIQEYRLNQFFENNKELLEKQKAYCWPLYYDSVDELSVRLMKEGYLYYVIYSSYGLNGWIVAKQYDVNRIV
ncbi:hypothetical protein [Paenibacillus methanolicus]|uniref:Uncharacterized protein n=1 Tax=Paenibacillus methanolicus TaxID=582686 RepID=A0A5S5CL47_9BACL|nr:hypothetical protein [Paenibacillus methanolicus]TYP79435.1 hypothetical protein BCM02_101553 [Paenibacillus methanolicus]